MAIFTLLILLAIIIVFVGFGLIITAIKSSDKKRYKLTANIGFIIIAIALSIGLQFMAKTSLSEKPATEVNHLSMTTENTNENYPFYNDNEEFEEETPSNQQTSKTNDKQTMVSRVVMFLCGSFIVVVLILGTYKSQYKIELNKIIKEEESQKLIEQNKQ